MAAVINRKNTKYIFKVTTEAIFENPIGYTLMFDCEHDALARKMLSKIGDTLWLEGKMIRLYEKNFSRRDKINRARLTHMANTHVRNGTMPATLVVTYAMFRSGVEADFTTIKDDTDCECYRRAEYIMRRAVAIRKRGPYQSLYRLDGGARGDVDDKQYKTEELEVAR